jgi:hypothetical protein
MAIKHTIALLLMLSCCSCSIDGRLYTDKVIPFSEDFDNTEVGTKTFIIDDFKIKEPVSGYSISVEWMNSNLKENAKKAGIKKIHYADLRVFSVLMGIYSKTSLIVYGD